jgi:Dipeptidyl aminopeptidases/acylaminoacyl-peptidases
MQIGLCKFLFMFCYMFSNVNFAVSQSKFEEIVLNTEKTRLYGTLTLPSLSEPVPLVIIIPGSGPTDRDGNNPSMKTYSLKMLGDSLASRGIASFRYDKRGIGQSRDTAVKEEDLRYRTYANDAAEWIKLLQTDKRFSKIVIIGHSEGSMVGMLAAQKAKVNGFVSIAGPGRSADKVLRDQLNPQPKAIRDIAYPIIDSLVAGKTIKDVHPMLASLFRPSVQPYLISWFRHDPALEINRLTIPILIVHGANDLQVPLADAELLQSANKSAEVVVIEGMNHIMKESEANLQQNLDTYYNSKSPIASQLVKECVEFIRTAE